MFGYDHEFEGKQGEPCQAEVRRSNRSFDHLYARDPDTGVVTWGRTGPDTLPCLHDGCSAPEAAAIHQPKAYAPCGASWTSALHPPDQFRHWCSALEAGADCMHFED
jgi:hypothetical protein